MAFLTPLKGKRSLATALTVALVAGGTLTVAALHPGFPVADVDLTARDVWVTNGEQLLGGRLNRQIEELSGSVVASSPNFDVMQDGDTLLLLDPDLNRLESVDASTTQVTSSIDLPPDADVAFGGGLIAIVGDGKLWVIPAAGDLQFNRSGQPPVAEVGTGARVAVSTGGIVVVVSPESGELIRVPSIGEAPVITEFPKVGEFQLSFAGDRAVVLDQSTNQIVLEGGRTIDLGAEPALELQQTSPVSGAAFLSTAGGLLRVQLDSGEVQSIDGDVSTPTSELDDVAAPVFVDGCAHGAWAQGQRYLLACDGSEPQYYDIAEPTTSALLEFRVNRSVIALNDVRSGNAWVPSENLRLVDNWDDVTPPVEEESPEEGDEQSATQSFEDTLAERTDENRAPTAVDDEFGLRPGRTTILSLLDNDSDPDGDVLVVSKLTAVADSTGLLDLIDGGRALQFTPAPGFVGAIAFDYTIDDGRGGTATARVTARVVAEGSNESPFELRRSGVSVEANQTVEYNVLSNWRDPDGDDLYLVGASPQSADLVRFTPDGLITFTHQTSEVGEKEVQFLVTDGNGVPAPGTLTVTVSPANSLNPVGTPDFATMFVGESTVIEPLANDISPSGQPLALTAIEEPASGAAASVDTDRNEVRFSATEPGIYYFKYTVQAGPASSVGIVRVDVREPPADLDIPPVAVKDTAYLRGDEPVTISVLANDVSPAGRILAVQSVTIPPETRSKGVVVELLASTLVRVTSSAALTEQVSFTYTVSDGVSTATAGVTVVPVPALTKHQPPVARDDVVTVRSGDIVTVDVLENDFHPDDVTMYLGADLVSEPDEGIAFVSGNTVRFQAPDSAGQLRAEYLVRDQFGETSAAAITFTVTPVDVETNNDPRPTDLIGRVLAGNSVRIDLPLGGVDADGDSVQLLRFPAGPALGTVIEQGTDYFVYEAAPMASGTDTFRYQVYDAFGATGDAEVRIAVIPPPDTTQNPSAVPDSVSIRPGRVAQLDLMANDSDPQGAAIKVSPELLDVPDGIDARVVDERYLLIDGPETEQSFSLRYELTNDRGGIAVSYVLVQVTDDAPLLPPTAKDVPIALDDVVGLRTFTVDVFDGFAINPAGANDDLVVSLEGPNAGNAELVEGRPGEITVTLGESRQAIAYRATNVDDGLSAMAFILVPPAVDEGFNEPPTIDPDLPPQYVPMNEAREWNLADILVVPSGREAWIPDGSTVTSIMSDGTSNFVDRDTIRYQGAADYRGPASVTFTVTDGASADDPSGNTITLTLPIIVGDPEFRDTAPEFSSPTLELEMGEQATLDLRASTAHPNPQILQEVVYSNLAGAGDRLTASLSGSQLTVSTPRTTPKGTTFELDVTLRWDQFAVPGTITVVVVRSSKPPAVAVDDTYETQRGDGPVLAMPLGNDSNPYASTGEPLTIVAAEVQNTGEPAGLSFTGSAITVTPNPALKAGTIVVVYTIEDATRDADRRVNGTVTVVVSDVPDQVARPTTPTQGDDRSVTIGFQAPASNGKPIERYEVVTNPSVTTPTDCTPPSCTISGLTNGTSYTFAVRAINVHGPGEWSPVSNPVIPYGTPGTPVVTLTLNDPWAPDAIVSASWGGVSANGGTVTYFWELFRDGASTGRSGNGTSTSTGQITNLDQAGSYSVRVYAVNSGGVRGADGVSTAGSVSLQSLPPTPSVTATVTDEQAPGAIRWNWGAVSAAQGGSSSLTYQVSSDGGATWSSVGTALSHTRSNLPQGSHELRVRAVNKAGAGASSAPVSATIAAPPPNPRVTNVYPAGAASTQSGVTNTKFLYFDIAEWTPGTYTVTPQYCRNGVWGNVAGSYSMNLSSSGTYQPGGTWMQSGFANCGVRVVIGGYTSPTFNTWAW